MRHAIVINASNRERPHEKDVLCSKWQARILSSCYAENTVQRRTTEVFVSERNPSRWVQR